MKTNVLSILVSISLILTLFTGCNLSEPDDGVPKDFFVDSYEKVSEYKPAFIKAILEQFAGAYPEFEEIVSKVEYGVTVYRLNYNTTFRGEDIVASGLVCVPDTIGEFPTLSYQNGTNTLHSKAPSVDPSSELFLMLEFISSTGFVITIPDYVGFGASQDVFHPYLDKESTVQAVLDMQRATKELIKNYLRIDVSDDLYIAGYSQGGWATMQVQKAIEENFSTIFDLKASACGAGPYDLNYINEYVLGLDEYPMPYFLGYIFNSYYNLEEITTPIEDIFQEPYADKIPLLYDGTKAGEEINGELTTKIPMLFTPNFIENFDTDENFQSVNASLEKNSISAWQTTTPTMLLHGTEDTFVPPTITNKIHQDFLSEGLGVNDIILVPLQGEDHQSGIIKAGIAQISWFLELKDANAM